jgi:glycosyltransferase involved in cell wall biosynthesis
MNTPLLSIVIPSYNRAASLAALLHDFKALDLADPALLEIIVCNNCSTDDTAAVLAAFETEGKFRLTLINRPVNLGMEGNIASSMLEGKGKYIWLLSDHQRFLPEHFPAFLEVLDRIEFDVGYVQIAQWAPVLPSKNTTVSWDSLSNHMRGAVLFTMGNISGLVYRRTFALPAAKAIFAACYSGYPHLGLISRFSNETRLAEFAALSAFPSKTEGKHIVHEYDTVEVRYSKNLECVERNAKSAHVTFARSGFFTADYCASFKRDVLWVLLNGSLKLVPTIGKLKRLLPYNPLPHKALIVFVLASLILVPGAMRTRLASIMRQRIIDGRRAKLAGNE